ncbi:MAG: Holliday junction branch migration DNA helicase RuvB [Peptococcaceae bacterium]|nr:Holliday junction branch migration DNA helicase RuvB [Peptococcaceae bacterium]
MLEERIISSNEIIEDVKIQKNLRPKRFSDYIGQNRVKTKLKVYVEAARVRGEALDHCLFYGPPGLGKTTLAQIIANEMEVNIHITSGPSIERPGDLVALLTNLQPYDLLFIDEIHRLNRAVEEVLYSAMEDYVLDIIIGKGPSARSLRMDLPPFTLIGATTRAGSLSSPLRDRFGIIERLQFYSVEELAQIININARYLDIPVNDDGARLIASRSRGTPRIANRLLNRVRDFAQVEGQGIIDVDIASYALDRLEVDAAGLDKLDRDLLLTIMEQYKGGPVGLDTLAASIGEERVTLEDVCEPYLLQEGFLARTPRGRVATEKAYQHFGKPMPKKMLEASQQIEIFAAEDGGDIETDEDK